MAKYIDFEEVPGAAPKTKWWTVNVKDCYETIGQVHWYGPWRKYCFFPEFDTVYEEVCLRDIAQFCQEKTAEHRAAKIKGEPSASRQPA